MTRRAASTCGVWRSYSGQTVPARPGLAGIGQLAAKPKTGSVRTPPSARLAHRDFSLCLRFVHHTLSRMLE